MPVSFFKMVAIKGHKVFVSVIVREQYTPPQVEGRAVISRMTRYRSKSLLIVRQDSLVAQGAWEVGDREQSCQVRGKGRKMPTDGR